MESGEAENDSPQTPSPFTIIPLRYPGSQNDPTACAWQRTIYSTCTADENNHLQSTIYTIQKYESTQADMSIQTLSLAQALVFFLVATFATGLAQQVVVETIQTGTGPSVTKAHRYESHVTLYIEDTATKEKTPSGWSTRKADGASADTPFSFQPGVNLIPGWTEGVLQMKEGERALLHVPAQLGYGSQSMGSKNGGSFYIPANSDLLFDIEILGMEGPPGQEF
jgi:FKBP-type peptidyl-prolyl cis-trans isomerase